MSTVTEKLSKINTSSASKNISLPGTSSTFAYKVTGTSSLKKVGGGGARYTPDKPKEVIIPEGTEIASAVGGGVLVKDSSQPTGVRRVFQSQALQGVPVTGSSAKTNIPSQITNLPDIQAAAAAIGRGQTAQAPAGSADLFLRAQAIQELAKQRGRPLTALEINRLLGGSGQGENVEGYTYQQLIETPEGKQYAREVQQAVEEYNREVFAEQNPELAQQIVMDSAPDATVSLTRTPAEGESYVPGLGYVSTPVGQQQGTLTITQPTLAETEVTRAASARGTVGGLLNLWSEKFARPVGEGVTELITTDLEINPYAGGKGQGLFRPVTVRGSEEPIITIGPASGDAPRIPTEVRGTSSIFIPPSTKSIREELSITKPAGTFLTTPITSKEDLIRITPSDIGRATTGAVEIAPFLIPYAGLGLFGASVAERLVPMIKESGVKQGTLEFIRQNPAEVALLGAAAAVPIVAGTRRVFATTTTPLLSRGERVLSQNVKVIQPFEGSLQDAFLFAERTVRTPKIYGIQDSIARKAARKVLDLYEPGLSKEFTSLTPKRVQLTPSITTRYTFEAPIREYAGSLFIGGNVRTQRMLPSRTKFTSYRPRDVSSNFLKIELYPGFKLPTGATQGFSSQFLLPSRGMTRVTRSRVSGMPVRITRRAPGIRGGRRLTLDLGRPSASLFVPTPRVQVVRSQRIPIRISGEAMASELPTIFRGDRYTMRRYGQRARDITRFRSNLRTGPIEKGELDILTGRKPTPDVFIPETSNRRMPSNVLTSEQIEEALLATPSGENILLSRPARQRVPTRTSRQRTPQVSLSTKSSLRASGAQARPENIVMSTQEAQRLVTQQRPVLDIASTSRTSSVGDRTFSIERARTRSRVSVAQVQRPAQQQRQRDLLVQRARFRTRQVEVPQFRIPDIRITRMPRPRPIETPVRERRYRLQSGFPRRQRRGIFGENGDGFIGFVRRRGTFVPVTGRTSFERALETGKNVARGTLGASVRVFSTRRGAPVQLTAEREFRLGSAGRDPFTIVQRQTRRLSSPGERVEIIKSRRNIQLI